MNSLKLPAHGLYILSGIPASGKSTLLNNSRIDRSAIISSDQLRVQLFGKNQFELNNQIKSAPYAFADHIVFKMMAQMAEARLQQHLTTFIDTTAINDSVRRRWIELANEYHCHAEVLIFDIDLKEALLRNQIREFFVPEEAIQSFHQRLQKDSEYPFQIIDQTIESIELMPREIPHHYYQSIRLNNANLDHFRHQLNKLKPNQSAIFLGNFFTNSYDHFDLAFEIKHLVESHQHYAVLDYSASKLLKLWRSYSYHKDSSKVPDLTHFLKLSSDEQYDLIDFFNRLPAYYVDTKTKQVYSHRRVEFDQVIDLPKETCVTGLIR